MEATIICIDNSEWTRSGDYAPSRFEAQVDAVNLLAGAKTQANPENTVGVLVMAGKTPRVLVTPTPDLGKVLKCMTDMQIEGETNVASSVQIAQLALKHRQNKVQRQRIVIFAGSPIKEDKDKLVRIAKKLKKNNVAVDMISFGCEQENEDKLEAFHQAVNNSNSHLVVVPPGPVLSDVLIGSPIFQGGSGGSGSAYGLGGGEAGGEEGGFQFGVDPNLDPELALALRVSLQEERARQAAAAAAQQGASGEGAASEAPGAEVVGEGQAPGAAAGSSAAVDMDTDENALLQQALAMSMQVDEDNEDKAQSAAPTAKADDGFDDMDDELRKAMQLSMQDVIDVGDKSDDNTKPAEKAKDGDGQS